MDARHDGFGYEVNGQYYPTDDRVMKGRDIRIGAGLNPAANWRLIEIMDRYTTSVGLEDIIEFEAGLKRVFRAAEGDRDYDFTLDDLGWEWCSPSINESELRRYGRVPADKELVVEGPSERVVGTDEDISFAGAGVERIYSRPITVPAHLKLTFIVGGDPHEITAQPSELLRNVLERVLTATEHVGRPVDDWRVTDEPGKVFELGATLAAQGIHNGMILVVNLKTGEAG